MQTFPLVPAGCNHSRGRRSPIRVNPLHPLSQFIASENFYTLNFSIVTTATQTPTSSAPALGDSKPSSNSKGNSTSARNTLGPDNNTLLDIREVPADCRIPSPSLQVFKFADLKRATSDFSLDMLLRDDDFGKVFLGWVDKNTFSPSSFGVGMAVSVKMCTDQNSQGNAEWLAEVSLLGRMAHPNIISLLGYCNDEEENLLVYEYMRYTSFDRFLFANAELLSWGRRLNIMMGVARGLTYLHSSEVQLIHRDIKSSTILLDKDFTAKLGDFGVARSGSGIGNTTHVLGSFVYLDPEYLRAGHLTAKSDIYGFGVMLLETLTGQQAIDEKRPVQQQNLVTWIPFLAVGMLSKEELKKIMDTCLEKNYPIEGALECVKLAVRCVALDPKDRPSIEEVLRSLEAICAVTSNGHTSPHTTIH